MTVSRAYHRQCAIDALDDYAAFLTEGTAAGELEKRNANLRAALASIEAKASKLSVFAELLQPFEARAPVQVAFTSLAAAARGALDADDREATRNAKE